MLFSNLSEEVCDVGRFFNYVGETDPLILGFTGWCWSCWFLGRGRVGGGGGLWGLIGKALLYRMLSKTFSSYCYSSWPSL